MEDEMNVTASKNVIEQEIAEDYMGYMRQKLLDVVGEGTARVRSAFSRGYAEGLDAAWVIAYRLMELPEEDVDRLFGTKSVFDVIGGWTPDNVKGQLDAFKKYKYIREGDEVVFTKDESKKFIVISLVDGKLNGVTKDGKVITNADPKHWNRTGKHFDKLILDNSLKFTAVQKPKYDIPF